jgi:predicted N-formylglutamate amidohydrolase
MLMSELADELKMDAGNMSRQVRLYYRLQERDRPGRLDDKAVSDLRQAHALVVARAVSTYPQALKQVLGLVAAPVPAASVAEIKQVLTEIRDSQLRTDKRINAMAKRFKALLDQLDKQGQAVETDADDELSGSP